MKARALETQIERLMDRLVDSSGDLTSKAFERKIEHLEKERLLAEDQLANSAKERATPRQIRELATKFRVNPYKLWPL